MPPRRAGHALTKFSALITGFEALRPIVYSIFPPSWGPEMLAPKKRQAKAWTLVPHFARRTVSSASDASLRLTAQEDDEIRALAGLRAQLLV